MDGDRRKNRDSSSAGQFERLGEGAFHGTLAASRGVVAVLFTAPRCGACRAWKALLPRALDGVAARYVEVDASEATGVARYYGIFHLPTIYLFRDGVFHAELPSPARAEAIRKTALALLAEAAQEEP